MLRITPLLLKDFFRICVSVLTQYHLFHSFCHNWGRSMLLHCSNWWKFGSFFYFFLLFRFLREYLFNEKVPFSKLRVFTSQGLSKRKLLKLTIGLSVVYCLFVRVDDNLTPILELKLNQFVWEAKYDALFELWPLFDVYKPVPLFEIDRFLCDQTLLRSFLEILTEFIKGFLIFDVFVRLFFISCIKDSESSLINTVDLRWILLLNDDGLITGISINAVGLVR